MLLMRLCWKVSLNMNALLHTEAGVSAFNGISPRRVFVNPGSSGCSFAVGAIAFSCSHVVSAATLFMKRTRPFMVGVNRNTTLLLRSSKDFESKSVQEHVVLTVLFCQLHCVDGHEGKSSVSASLPTWRKILKLGFSDLRRQQKRRKWLSTCTCETLREISWS